MVQEDNSIPYVYLPLAYLIIILVHMIYTLDNNLLFLFVWIYKEKQIQILPKHHS